MHPTDSPDLLDILSFCGLDFSLHVTGEINGSYLFWNPQWGLRDVASQLNEGPSVRDNYRVEGGGPLR